MTNDSILVCRFTFTSPAKTFKDESSGRSSIDALLSLNHRKVDPQKYSKLTEYNAKFNGFFLVCLFWTSTDTTGINGVLVMRGGNRRQQQIQNRLVSECHTWAGATGLRSVSCWEGWRAVGNDCCQCASVKFGWFIQIMAADFLPAKQSSLLPGVWIICCNINQVSRWTDWLGSGPRWVFAGKRWAVAASLFPLWGILPQ